MVIGNTNFDPRSVSTAWFVWF